MLTPGLPDRASAFFLDFDGSLVELASHPDALAAIIPAFRHRRPWFFGDDVKIGDGETLAAHCLPDPGALREWLQHAGDHLERLGVDTAGADLPRPAHGAR